MACQLVEILVANAHWPVARSTTTVEIHGGTVVHGGGLAYLQQPSFGYLAGFIPAAWLCGRRAKQPGMDSLEHLTGTACLGVLTIQLCGLLNLGLGSLARRWGESLPQLLITYSLMPLPALLLLGCVVGVMARLLRPLLLVNR